MKYDGFKRTAHAALLLSGGFICLVIGLGFFYGGFEVINAIITYYIYYGASALLTAIMTAFGAFVYICTVGVVVAYFLGWIVETLQLSLEEIKNL